MKKHELKAYEKAGIKVTICKPAKARGSKSFSNFKSNSKRMRGYKQYNEPQGHKVSSIYNLGPESDNGNNQSNASHDRGRKSGNTTSGSSLVHCFNRYSIRNEGHWG